MSPAAPLSARLARMGYRRARRLLTVAGLAILGVLVAVLLIRSVDSTEVIATLLYAPIFLLLLFFGLPGGLLGAAAATVAYVVLRSDAVAAVGWGQFASLILARGIAYFLFGGVGGLASSTLERSLDKLDLYDEIDDQTGLKNARFLLGDVDLEAARSRRYQTVFSVSFVEIEAAPLDALPSRGRRVALRELGRKLEDGVRNVDRVAHGYDGSAHRIATVLPETAGEGAAIFHRRLIERLLRFLTDHGVDPAVAVTGVVVTIPGDDEDLDAQLAGWRQIDAAEHDHAPT